MFRRRTRAPLLFPWQAMYPLAPEGAAQTGDRRMT
jgi:hypothetical protein